MGERTMMSFVVLVNEGDKSYSVFYLSLFSP